MKECESMSNRTGKMSPSPIATIWSQHQMPQITASCIGESKSRKSLQQMKEGEAMPNRSQNRGMPDPRQF
jgi:hypothetical protein